MAVKEMHFQDQGEVDQLRRNEVILSMLHHPNICHYYGVEVHRNKVNILSKVFAAFVLAS